MASLPETGLYLHVPFCAVKCRFCDFAAFPGRKNDIPRYLNALRRELEVRAASGRRRLETFYAGGGTPSLLDPDDWRMLMAGVWSSFEMAPGGEASLEANPDGMTEEKLAAWRDSGINRLSLGLQSDDPALLATLGRTHSWTDLMRGVRSARGFGFDNINVDLMFGLPGQTVEGWVDTVKRVLSLGPEHVSAYGLQVEETTYFHRSGVVEDQDLQAEMYDTAADLLESAGYLHYEISNFAKPGFECRHNLRYWRNQECLGVGVSAAWYDGTQRHTNTDHLTRYMESVESQGSSVCETVLLSPDQREGENLMLGLRLKEGVRPTREGLALYGTALDRHVGEGLLIKDEGRYRPTRIGWRLSNRIFVDLLGELTSKPLGDVLDVGESFPVANSKKTGSEDGR